MRHKKHGNPSHAPRILGNAGSVSKWVIVATEQWTPWPGAYLQKWWEQNIGFWYILHRNSRGGGKQQLNHYCCPLSIIHHLLPIPCTVWLLCLLLLFLSLLLPPLFLSTPPSSVAYSRQSSQLAFMSTTTLIVSSNACCLPPCFQLQLSMWLPLAHLLFDCCFFFSRQSSVIHPPLSIIQCPSSFVVLSPILSPMPPVQPPQQF